MVTYFFHIGNINHYTDEHKSICILPSLSPSRGIFATNLNRFLIIGFFQFSRFFVGNIQSHPPLESFVIYNEFLILLRI
ncbi:unnamed protein product [Lactuca virosa]|uniref:Uncharacterized protein n=1 Tax=Lactuca virosa TaxID=75947 RepID=A0AAU9NY64_9ASTR|nr:unnamed protein product [Lactuca virosa]